jgi:hypothetical protein
VIAYQAHHLAPDLYARFYKPDAANVETYAALRANVP